MTTARTLATLQDVARLMQRCPGLFVQTHFRPELVEACRDLNAAAAALSRLAVQQCNGIDRYDPQARRMVATWTEQDEARKDKAQAKADAKARAALAVIFGPAAPVEIEFQRDPRGAMVKVWPAGKRDHGSPVLVA